MDVSMARSIAACIRGGHSILFRWQARQHDRAYTTRARLADQARAQIRSWFTEYQRRCYSLTRNVITQLSRMRLPENQFDALATSILAWLHNALLALEMQAADYINTEMDRINTVVQAMLDAAADAFEKTTAQTLNACIVNPAARPEMRDVPQPPYTPAPAPEPRLPDLPPEIVTVLGVGSSYALLKQEGLK